MLKRLRLSQFSTTRLTEPPVYLASPLQCPSAVILSRIDVESLRRFRLQENGC
jgi:hypothetical protein